jgi:hypothetical protein
MHPSITASITASVPLLEPPGWALAESASAEPGTHRVHPDTWGESTLPVAELIAAAKHDKARLHVISESLGVASHHTTFSRTWLEEVLAESNRLHDRTTAISVLNGAHFAARSAAAWHQIQAGTHPERED